MSALFEFCVTDSGELLSTETQPAVSELLSEVHWNCRMRKQILTAFRYKLTYARQAQNTTERAGCRAGESKQCGWATGGVRKCS